MNVKNRKCIRRLSFRSLWASRKRNMIAIIAISLTALLFTSLFTIAMSINSSYETYTFRQIGGYAHGTFKDVTKEQAEAIAGHDKVKAVGERKIIGVASDGAFSKEPAEISYMDDNCTKWSYAETTTGNEPQSGKEIAMDTEALKLLGIEPKLGTEITLTYTIGLASQLVYDKTDTFILSGYWEYDDISPVHYLNISKEYAESIESEASASGMGSFRTDLNVMMASSVDIRGQMEQVDLDLGYYWEQGAEGKEESDIVRIGVNWGYTTSQLEESMDVTTVLAIAAFLILVIFTGYLIIYNIFQISVTGDIRFYGLLKTIGVTPRQLRRIIRQQALFLCMIGIPLGLLLGYGVGAVLTPVVLERTSLGTISATVSTSPLIFIVSALFALGTVLLSCARPGRIAAKVSPVEATKYTEVIRSKRQKRSTRGAKVYQMAFANLGRNKLKTTLVVLSLALSVVLLNVLVSFVSGFDMEKYLEKMTCADFVVSSTDYFQGEFGGEEYFSEEMITGINDHTSQTLAGCGYTISGERPQSWMKEEAWKSNVGRYYPDGTMKMVLDQAARKNGLIAERILIEGLDEELFQKVTVVDGNLDDFVDEENHSIALVVDEDDYGNNSVPEFYPAIGETLTVTYVEESYYIDSRTGEKCNEDTPEEYLQYRIVNSHDVDYTVCAYVSVPSSMSYRYSLFGHSAILPVNRLENDSRQKVIPMFYLFDTPDETAEAEAENYLAELTEDDSSSLMYESKATVRAEFEGFRNMFLMLGGLLCAIIGIVGVLNFFNAIMTGILSRRREFAVLQAVGLTGRQLKAMLVYEGLFYALTASLLALGLSVLINPLVGRLLENMFWFFSSRSTVVPALGAIPVFALLGWLIPSIMYGQTAKHSVVERLREAE